MKKIILAVILLAAAGGTVYYFLQNKKTTTDGTFQKEALAGTWKIDSLALGKDSAKNSIAEVIFLLDSNVRNTIYDFRKGGEVLKLLKDTVQKDTSHYEWTKPNVLLWKEQGDSVGELLTVLNLTTDSLVLQTKDSTTIYLKRTTK